MPSKPSLAVHPDVSTTEHAEVIALDLVMEVTLRVSEGRTVLEYNLDSPTGAADLTRHRFQKTILGDAESFRGRLSQRLEDLRKGLDVEGAVLSMTERESHLKNLGQDLFHELIPTEMKSAYRHFRERVKTLLVISSEPWIPWELIRPYDDSDAEDVIDDEFWSERFQLTRWLAGQSTPDQELIVSQLAMIEGDAAGLPYLLAERELLHDLAQRHGVRDCSPEFATMDRLNSLLKAGGTGLIHVGGHGDFDEGSPNDSAITLPGGRPWRPVDLNGQVLTQLRRDRPLVFFNACRTAKLGWSLTGLGGWAERWVGRGACGAFIGPQWAVGDRPAFLFAHVFYGVLEAGASLGEATLAARRKVRQSFPGDPGPLAYAVYGSPHARLRWGNAASLARSDRPPLPPPEPQPLSLHQVILFHLQAWARAAIRTAQQRPVGCGLLAGTTALLVVLLGVGMLGLWTHRARELLLHIPPGAALNYPLSTLLSTGAEALWTLPWKASRILLSGPAAVTGFAWLLVLTATAWFWLAQTRRAAVLFLVLLTLNLTGLTCSSAFFRLGVRAFAPAQRGQDIVIPVPEPGITLPEQVIFESAAWLRNPSPTNNARREALNGLIFWLIVATVAGAWAGARRAGFTGHVSQLRWLLAAGHLVLLAFLASELPAAHAYGKWGLRYPRITGLRPSGCQKTLETRIALENCRVFDVSAQGNPLTWLFWCDDRPTYESVILPPDCRAIQRKRTVVFAVSTAHLGMSADRSQHVERSGNPGDE